MPATKSLESSRESLIQQAATQAVVSRNDFDGPRRAEFAKFLVKRDKKKRMEGSSTMWAMDQLADFLANRAP